MDGQLFYTTGIFPCSLTWVNFDLYVSCTSQFPQESSGDIMKQIDMNDIRDGEIV